MSGFDFDALRDPEAPFPGARERDAVTARARELRGRQRRNRFAMSATAIVAVAAIVFGVAATRHDSGPQVAVPGPTPSTTTVTTPTTYGASVHDRFIPPTITQNGLVELPITLPDGETFTMKYPPALRISQLGFGGGGGVVGFSGVSSRQVTIKYTTVQHLYGDTPPVAVYRGANGEQVPLFSSGPSTNGHASQLELVFQLGHWLVQVDDSQPPMTPSQLSTWARNLTGTEDTDGYLVLHAASPLRVANWFEGGFGSADDRSLNQVELANHLYCGQPESDTAAHRRFTNGDGTHGVSWCDDQLHVVASGAPDFVDLADRRLQVSTPTPLVDQMPTIPTTSTTTTTSPAGSASNPVSASFVSPAHGFALEQNGVVAETRDAGLTWNAIGQADIVSDTATHIRFADALHGFAFTTEPTGKARPLTTTDGGAHWTALATPTSAVSDLDISGGVVYLVGVPKTSSGTFPGFRIWSTPAGHIHWTMDPLQIPVGAGPIPFQQLTFAGGHGWMVNTDRDTISGAELASPNGHWTAWTPPCTGSTYLAATTAVDLVALCTPAFATGATRSTIAFSHDGGATFAPTRTTLCRR